MLQLVLFLALPGRLDMLWTFDIKEDLELHDWFKSSCDFSRLDGFLPSDGVLLGRSCYQTGLACLVLPYFNVADQSMSVLQRAVKCCST